MKNATLTNRTTTETTRTTKNNIHRKWAILNTLPLIVIIMLSAASLSAQQWGEMRPKGTPTVAPAKNVSIVKQDGFRMKDGQVWVEMTGTMEVVVPEKFNPEKEGKVWAMTPGVITPLSKEVILEDGTSIKSNGKIVRSDGTKIKMQEGDFLALIQ